MSTFEDVADGDLSAAAEYFEAGAENNVPLGETDPETGVVSDEEDCVSGVEGVSAYNLLSRGYLYGLSTFQGVYSIHRPICKFFCCVCCRCPNRNAMVPGTLLSMLRLFIINN